MVGMTSVPTLSMQVVLVSPPSTMRRVHRLGALGPHIPDSLVEGVVQERLQSVA